MLLDFNYVVQNIPVVLSLGAGIFLLKGLVVFLLVLFLKYPMRIAIIAGMGLAQVGEFSFILVKLGLSYELISSSIFQAFLASSIFTMIFTPFAFTLSPKAALRIEKGKIFRPLKKLVAGQNKKITAGGGKDEKAELEDHVIIVGYGLNGRNLAKVLKNRNIQYAIIELNPESVKEAAGKNETVVYGDATKAKILEEAGIRKAKVITFAISDALVIDHAVANARYLNDKVYIIARTKYVFDIDRLYELGADTVFAEEYETSIEILANVMLKYGFSKSAINKEINGLHEQRYAVIRDRHGEEKLEDKILRALHDEINIESYKINTKCSAEGMTIGELDLRARSGATIISIIRDKEQISNPPADFTLAVGDIIVLMGTPEQAEKAVELLN
jgi:CPA2 family monovalent cation:H+ antiporter-2